MGSKIEAKVSHHFEASAERVFDAWLDPKLVRVWMSEALKTFGLTGEIRRVEIDARIGGAFLFSDMRNGIEAEHWGTYLEMDRPRKIVFTWIIDKQDEVEPSKVTMSFEPVGEGCVVTMVHEMDAKWIDFVSKTEAGWGRMLGEIDKLVGVIPAQAGIQSARV